MDNLESKSNNELLFMIKQIEADFEALKIKIMKDYDNLTELDKQYQKVNGIIYKRLKGE